MTEAVGLANAYQAAELFRTDRSKTDPLLDPSREYELKELADA